MLRVQQKPHMYRVSNKLLACMHVCLCVCVHLVQLGLARGKHEDKCANPFQSGYKPMYDKSSNVSACVIIRSSS